MQRDPYMDINDVRDPYMDINDVRDRLTKYGYDGIPVYVCCAIRKVRFIASVDYLFAR